MRIIIEDGIECIEYAFDAEDREPLGITSLDGFAGIEGVELEGGMLYWASVDDLIEALEEAKKRWKK